MESLEERARAAGKAKRQSVRARMLASRTNAPRLYSKALMLHHTLTGAMPRDPRLAVDLEALVLAAPALARDVIGALEWSNADGGPYAEIVSVLHSMLARHALRDMLGEM